ncbi:MAG TPA: serine hydrolase [Blastocatellia bacterium]|nr:serine hydrolase [Blastocatellia bacterium]
MNRIRSIITGLLVLSVLALVFAVKPQAQDLASKIDEYMSALAKQERFSGSVLVARDGKVLFSRGYGMANLEFEVPNTPQTKFRIGSVTKQFTAAAIMLLQERGNLSVQDPVCKYLAKCPPAWDQITIHHLLTHTSGIPNFTNFPEYAKTMTIPATVDELLDRFKDRPLDFKPGEKMSYSNSGYVTLGAVVEKASGTSYRHFLWLNVFEPLKMTSSGYDTPDQILKNRAAGYSMNNGRKINASYLDMTIPHGAGALYSTVEDLFIWNEALFNDKLLSAKSREAMMTPVLNNYAYGLDVDRKFNRKVVGHSGRINGFMTVLTRFPEEKVTVVVLRNADFGTPAPGRISDDLAAIVFGETYDIPRNRVVVQVDPKIYDAYVGKYQVASDFVFDVIRDGDRLMGAPVGAPKLQLLPESETKFFAREIDADVTFVKDEKGQVTGLILNRRQGKKL